MTDRELLEAAAKAAGIELTKWCAEFPGGGVYLRRVIPEPPEPFSKELTWDPLSNDGDALRLAGEIKTCIDIEADEVVVYYAVGKYVREVPYGGGSIHSAMRRAIVRAAAHMEIFKEAQ